MSSDSKYEVGCAAIVLGVLVVVALTIGLLANLFRTEHASCLVEDKDRAAAENGSDMRVYTDCGIFRVKDSVFIGRWNSADVYQAIKVGETYDIEASGWRIGLLSWFPNIVSAEAVGQ